MLMVIVLTSELILEVIFMQCILLLVQRKQFHVVQMKCNSPLYWFWDLNFVSCFMR